MRKGRRLHQVSLAFIFLPGIFHKTRGEGLRNVLQAARVYVLKVTNEQMKLIYDGLLPGCQLKWFKERNEKN